MSKINYDLRFIVGFISLILLSLNSLAFDYSNNYYIKGGFGTQEKYSKEYRVYKSEDNFLDNENLTAMVAVGKRYNQVGVELGYSSLQPITLRDFKGYKELDVSGDNLSLDLVGYVPVIRNFEMKTFVGLGLFHTSKTEHEIVLMKPLNQETKPNAFHRANIAPRLGVGLEYGMSKSLSASYDLSYQKGNGDIHTKVANNLSLSYNFF